MEREQPIVDEILDEIVNEPQWKWLTSFQERYYPHGLPSPWTCTSCILGAEAVFTSCPDSPHVMGQAPRHAKASPGLGGRHDRGLLEGRTELARQNAGPRADRPPAIPYPLTSNATTTSTFLARRYPCLSSPLNSMRRPITGQPSTCGHRQQTQDGSKCFYHTVSRGFHSVRCDCTMFESCIPISLAT